MIRCFVFFLMTRKVPEICIQYYTYFTVRRWQKNRSINLMFRLLRKVPTADYSQQFRLIGIYAVAWNKRGRTKRVRIPELLKNEREKEKKRKTRTRKSYKDALWPSGKKK